MPCLIKNFLIFLIFIILQSILTTEVFASEEFFSEYDVTYEATLEGKLFVNQQVKLTNKLSNIYATEYSFSFDRVKISNITAFDSIGPLEVKSSQQDNRTEILIKFNDQVVGKDKTLNFNLKYEVSDLLKKSGQIWELTIPKIISKEIDRYILHLTAPLDFGNLAYISPEPISQKTEKDKIFFVFSKDQISNSGVTAAFGEFQVFDFNLSYYLENPENEGIFTKIALPPDTNYQNVSYQKINPQPSNIEVDSDGNWLAIYKLKSKEKINIKVDGQVKISAFPQKDFFEKKNNESLSRYLESQKYWEKDETAIVLIAQKLKNAREIYDYVIKTLDYDYTRVGKATKRMGAYTSLQNPQNAICMEYTDLFVALARASGIPARELNGYAYTDNPQLQPLSETQDVLHSWPEYWDFNKKMWIQIDPTWGDTTGGVDYFGKLDVGHLVFAIHGENSQWPYTAGSYKKEGSEQKDVKVVFGKYQEPRSKVISVEFNLPDNFIAEQEINGSIKVQNNSSEAIYQLDLNLVSTNVEIASERTKMIPALPPYASVEIPVKLKVEKIFSQGKAKIALLGNNQKFEYNLAYESILLNKILPILGGLLVITTLSIIAKKTWSLYLQKRKPGDSLHWESQEH